MRHRASLTLIALCCLLLAATLPGHAADEQALQRLDVGDLRLYYTGLSPSGIHYRGEPLIQGLYLYTAVQEPDGKLIEGFNFRRNEDGLLRFTDEKLLDGRRLTWENTRYLRRATGRSDKPAGTCRIVLTLTPNEITMQCTGKMEPNPGFGEIGFFVPEAILTGGDQAQWTATLPGGKQLAGKLPRPEDTPTNIALGLQSWRVESPRNVFDFTFTGQDFPGSNGVHLQDYRRQDTSRGCYRIVLGMGTNAGATFDYTWVLKLPQASPPTAPGSAVTALDPKLLPKVPPLPGKLEVFGPATPVKPMPASAGLGPLRVEVDDKNQFVLRDGDQVVATRDYCWLAGCTPKREDRQEGIGSRTVLTYDTPRGEVIKQAVVGPDEAWLLFTVRARQDFKGEVGFYTPQEAFKPPFIATCSINQAMVEPLPDLPASTSAYSIISGPAHDFREFQCGTATGPDWLFQDQRKGGGVCRYVSVLNLKPGDEWRGAFRYVRRSPEAYPAVGFDQSREERGILASLLADVIADGFTLVPARASRYALVGRALPVTLKVHATDDTARTVRVSCRLTDQWGRSLPGRDYVLTNQGRRFAAIQFPVTLPLAGSYRMDLSYSSGEVKGTRELVLTALPPIPDTGPRPTSVFGAALGGGDFLGTLAKRIGLKWNRCHCAIGDTQIGTILPERGQVRWDRVDAACDFHGKFGFWGCHSLSEGWTAPWFSAMFKEQPFEEYIKVWTDEYVRPLATHYQGRIRCWEVTNEPYYQYRDCPEKWVALLQATYRTLKDVDPGCTVVGTCGPPGSMGYSWYRRTFALGALDYQDAVSSHLYHFGPWVGAGTELTVRKWMQEIRAIMQEHGKVLPLWNSETTVSPPASLYRHPSHTRYIRYAPGQSPTDPIEQAQIYFKVLTIHKAEDVKYSFHIFHGGTEYDSHTGEYDETPLAFLAAQATLAKYLETAQYLGDLKLHGDLQACLFQQGRRLILIPWGPMFLKQDGAEVMLPLPVRRFTARDIFDNPLPLDGDAKHTRLLVTWEAFLLIADGVSPAELRQACAKAQVTLHAATEPGAAIRGAFGGDRAGAATRADWVGFHPVDLAPVANRGFVDEEPDDKQGGWTDEGPNDMRNLPVGDWRINGVPFRILDPAQHGGKSCVILKGGPSPNVPFPERVSIPVGQRLSKLHFLHTATWAPSSGLAFTYVLHYQDGVTEEVPVQVGRKVADWWTLGPLPEAKVAWEGPNGAHDKVRLYQAECECKHPKGAQAVLDRLEVVTGGGRAIPVVVAITGVYSN